MTDAQPVLRADFAHGDTVNGFFMRYDTPLNDDDDILFALPAGYEEKPFAAPHWKPAY
jgi:hypothetical protein